MVQRTRKAKGARYAGKMDSFQWRCAAKAAHRYVLSDQRVVGSAIATTAVVGTAAPSTTKAATTAAISAAANAGGATTASATTTQGAAITRPGSDGSALLTARSKTALLTTHSRTLMHLPACRSGLAASIATFLPHSTSILS
jgi:hypothetical protein